MKRPLLLIAILLAGCASYGDHQRQGMRSYLDADALQAPAKRVEVYVPAMIVILSGDQSKSPCGPCSLGCYNGSEIWVIATERDGKIYPNQAVLGHEIQHALNKANKTIANPVE